MPRTKEELGNVTLLGNQNTKYSYDYTPEILETFPNKHPEHDYLVTFDAYEFTSLCLTGDTKIKTARNENKFPEGVPIKDIVGTSGYVFGFDVNKEEVVCRRYHDVRKTGSNMPVVKIRMNYFAGPDREEKFSYLRCTPDHLILVKTHWHEYAWIKAMDLKPGMHLVYGAEANDYIRNRSKHRLIASQIFGMSLEDMSDLDVHHKDHNHFNNEPTNLEILTKHDHQHHHRSEDYGYDSSLDINVLIQEYEDGMNVKQLADKYHCDYSTIKNRLTGKVRFRTQSESLALRNKIANRERDLEMCDLYKKGYTSYEIGDYFDVHETTVLASLRRYGVEIRDSNEFAAWRRANPLPPLNHRVVSIEPDGFEDVYNMEVEDIHNFFADGIVVHNCPRTGQPDMAKIVISYIPNVQMLESKSLKLYLFSFRSRGDFHEDCTNIILNDLIALMDPKYIEIKSIFAPRGGIAIFPAVNWVNPKFPEYNSFKEKRMLQLLEDASNRTVRYDM